jgi:uncharacterized protein (TIGR00369 family)
VTPQALDDFLAGALPQTAGLGVAVVSAAEGRARISARPDAMHLRPGGIVSGPALFALADIAFYVALLSRDAAQRMAVTISLTMNFLRAAPPGVLLAEATVLRMGRRVAFGEMRVLAGGELVSTATGSYALAAGG